MKLIVMVAVALAACGSSPAKPQLPPWVVKTPEPVPMPYTVEQLRAANPQGRIVEMRIEQEGKPVQLESMDFIKVDEKAATIRSRSHDEGSDEVQVKTAESTWTKLHDGHRQLLGAHTTFEDNVEISVPAGTFKTRLYTFKADGAVHKLWLSSVVPGLVVQLVTEKDGKVVMRAQMVRAK